MIRVSHFGFHFAAGNVGYLLQAGGEQSIHPIDSPFSVARGTGRCPHRIILDKRDDSDVSLLNDPLAKWMARPEGVAVIDGVQHDTLVEALTQLYWPTRPLMIPAWGYSRVWRQELSCTNAAPWIMVGATVDQVDLLRATEHYPRPVLVLAASPVPAPGGVRLETELRETDLPDPMALQRLGAWAAYERLKRP